MTRGIKDMTDQDVPLDRKKKIDSAIERAKASSPTARPGPLTTAPDFKNLPKAEPDVGKPPPASKGLSDQTAAGLAALRFAPPEETETSKTEATEEEKNDARKTIESRLDPMDIGQFIENGRLTQRVSIIPGKLSVTFQTTTDGMEEYVDKKIREWVKERPIDREYARTMSRFALALQIVEYNDRAWPRLFDSDGEIKDEAVQERLALVRELPSFVFLHLSQNLSWFLERVERMMNLEVLGNG